MRLQVSFSLKFELLFKLRLISDSKIVLSGDLDVISIADGLGSSDDSGEVLKLPQLERGASRRLHKADNANLPNRWSARGCPSKHWSS